MSDNSDEEYNEEEVDDVEDAEEQEDEEDDDDDNAYLDDDSAWLDEEDLKPKPQKYVFIFPLLFMLASACSHLKFAGKRMQYKRMILSQGLGVKKLLNGLCVI